MSPNRFVLAANEAASPEDLAARFEREGWRHLLFVPREAKRLGEGYGVFAFTERGAANWAGLGARLETLFEEPGRCRLLRMR